MGMLVSKIYPLVTTDLQKDPPACLPSYILFYLAGKSSKSLSSLLFSRVSFVFVRLLNTFHKITNASDCLVGGEGELPNLLNVDVYI